MFNLSSNNEHLHDDKEAFEWKTVVNRLCFRPVSTATAQVIELVGSTTWLYSIWQCMHWCKRRTQQIMRPKNQAHLSHRPKFCCYFRPNKTGIAIDMLARVKHTHIHTWKNKASFLHNTHIFDNNRVINLVCFIFCCIRWSIVSIRQAMFGFHNAIHLNRHNNKSLARDCANKMGEQKRKRYRTGIYADVLLHITHE